MRMLYVFTLVFSSLASLTLFGDEAVEKFDFAEAPKYIHIDRRPARPLHYEICLLQAKNGDEQDRLGVVSARPNKECPSQSELNSQSPAEREAEKKLNKVYSSPEVDGGLEATAPMKGRMWKIAKAAGFFRQVNSDDGKTLWDPFCVAKIETVDSGEQDEKLVVCNKKKAPLVKSGEPLPPFTCEGIAACVGTVETLKVEKPNQIGKHGGDSRNGDSSGDTNVDDGSSSGTSGRTHKTP